MAKDARRKALEELQDEYAGLEQQRKEIEMRMTRVRSAIVALATLDNLGADPFDRPLAEAIRLVLAMDDNLAFTPTELRDQLGMLGYDLTKHSNPLASIHSVLKRFVESGEVLQMDKDGKPHYAFAKNWGTMAAFGKPEVLNEVVRQLTRTDPDLEPPRPRRRTLADLKPKEK